MRACRRARLHGGPIQGVIVAVALVGQREVAWLPCFMVVAQFVYIPTEELIGDGAQIRHRIQRCGWRRALLYLACWIRFGKLLSDGSRIAQVISEDVVFVVDAEDAALLLSSPTRFLLPTVATLAPERVDSIVFGEKSLRRNAVTGRWSEPGKQSLIR